jgi:hypothetical protein
VLRSLFMALPHNLAKVNDEGLPYYLAKVSDEGPSILTC